jgi:ribosome-binding factor A
MAGSMTEFKRTDRVSDAIRVELAEILRTRVKDPRVGFVTITAVDVSDDLRYARVHVSALENTPGARRRALEGLDRATAFIRGELGRRLKLRHTPEVKFVEDESLDNLERITELLDRDRRSGGGEGEG